MWICSFPTLFVEDSALSLLTGLGIIVEDHLTIYMTVCFWALCFIPLVYLSLCHYHTVWLLWLCNVFWNQDVWVFQLCSFQNYFSVLDSFRFHRNFRLNFSEGKKKCHWDFDRDYIWSVDCFGYYGHLNTIEPSNYEHRVSFHLFME